MRIDFDPVDHSYTTEYGQPLVPVTTLCGLTPRAVDYDKIPNKKAVENARERGSFIHKEIEDFIKTGVEGMSEVCKWFKRTLYPMFTNWQSEVIVYHIDGNKAYAGQVDLIAQDKKGKYIIIDLKNGGHSTVDYQTSFYAKAFAEMNGLDAQDIDRACIDAHNEDDIEFFRVRQIPDAWLEDLIDCYFSDMPYTEPLPTLKGFSTAQISHLMELEAYISTIEKDLDKLKTQRENFRSQLLTAMTDAMVDTFELPSVKVTRVKESDSEKFNTIKFKKDHPTLYKKYTTTERKKSYLKVTLRDITKKESK